MNTVDSPDRAGDWIRRIEIGLLTALFLAIVVVGLVQIALRNFADDSLIWAAPAMRAGVLWITMLAAVRAAAEARHIRIDVAAAQLPESLRIWLARAMHLATAAVCITLAAASVSLVELERSFADVAFLGVPRWTVLAIIPLGFGLMAMRFVQHAFVTSNRSGTDE